MRSRPRSSSGDRRRNNDARGAWGRGSGFRVQGSGFGVLVLVPVLVLVLVLVLRIAPASGQQPPSRSGCARADRRVLQSLWIVTLKDGAWGVQARSSFAP
jgi:hypothetical protein